MASRKKAAFSLQVPQACQQAKGDALETYKYGLRRSYFAIVVKCGCF